MRLISHLLINESVEWICSVSGTDVAVTEIIGSDFVPDVTYRGKAKTVQTTNVGLLTSTSIDDTVPLPTLSVKGKTYRDVVLCDDLSLVQKEQLESILKDFQDVLTDTPGTVTAIEPHTIHLSTENPVSHNHCPSCHRIFRAHMRLISHLRIHKSSHPPQTQHEVVLNGSTDEQHQLCSLDLKYKLSYKISVHKIESHKS